MNFLVCVVCRLTFRHDNGVLPENLRNYFPTRHRNTGAQRSTFSRDKWRQLRRSGIFVETLHLESTKPRRGDILRTMSLRRSWGILFPARSTTMPPLTGLPTMSGCEMKFTVTGTRVPQRQSRTKPTLVLLKKGGTASLCSPPSPKQPLILLFERRQFF